MTVPAENQDPALVPECPFDTVTRWMVLSIAWKTPSEENVKYSTATATTRMTQPTSETRKLNFRTENGSILVSTSCASRTSAAPGRAVFGADCAVGWRSDPGLLPTVTVGLLLPI